MGEKEKERWRVSECEREREMGEVYVKVCSLIRVSK